MSRLRCGKCGRSVPEERTALVWGHSTGDFRRSGRSIQRRVCDTCVTARVAYCRGAQAEQRNAPLNDHHVRWADAADRLGIDTEGLIR